MSLVEPPPNTQTYDPGSDFVEKTRFPDTGSAGLYVQV